MLNTLIHIKNIFSCCGETQRHINGLSSSTNINEPQREISGAFFVFRVCLGIVAQVTLTLTGRCVGDETDWHLRLILTNQGRGKD